MQQAFKLVSAFYLDASLAGIVFLVILAYVTGHLLSYISSMTVEKYSEWTIGYPSRYIFEENRLPSWRMGLYLYFDRYYNPRIIKNRSAEEVNNRARWTIRIQRFFVALFLLPFSSIIILMVMVGMNDTFRKGIMADLARILRKKADKKLKALGFRRSSSLQYHGELFKLLYHYVIETKPHHRVKMQNYLALYVYARTISLSFVISFWATMLIHIRLINSAQYWFSLLMLSIFSSLFYLAFVKFYRKFTLECYMAIAAHEAKTRKKHIG